MKRPEKKRDAVHFHDLIIDDTKANGSNPMQKRSIREIFEQEVLAGSKGGDDLAMSLGQSSMMVFGNKFKNPKKTTDHQKPPHEIGLLNSNGIDCNTESSRSIGLIGSGAYHHYKGDIVDANSLRFGAFSAFSALRASPLKESQQESRAGSTDIRSPQNVHQAGGNKSIENSMCSGNGAKLQHEVFFEKQQTAMRQLMQGLLSQPQKQVEKQPLQRVQKTIGDVSTGQSFEDRVKNNKRLENENCSPNVEQAQWPTKEDANLKIEELSNSKISFREEPQFRQRESRWQQDQSKSTYSINSQSIIPEENFQSLQGLMSEKERANLEIEKIKRNKSLTPLDKQKAIRSVKSLTRTIDDLIFREKDKISDHFESQLLSQIKFGNQQMPTKTDFACSDLFGLDKSNDQTSAQESGSFLVDQSSEQETKEMQEHELEQRPLKRHGTNDWKMQVTPLAQKLAFGAESTGMRLEDVNTSLNSIASSQVENGNPMKRSQILTKAKQQNLAQTLPTSNYNTQKAPQRHLQGRQSEYCTLQTNNDKNRKKGNFWQEAIAETEIEDESQRETQTINLHSSSLMNNKNNSIADIIMTTPSFDPGSKVSAAFLENSIADNSGIQLKNFSLGAVTIGNESADMMLSPSQQSQPQFQNKFDKCKPTETRPSQLEHQLISQLQDYVIKYQNVLQELDILLQNQEVVKATNNHQSHQIGVLEGHLKQADDI